MAASAACSSSSAESATSGSVATPTERSAGCQPVAGQETCAPRCARGRARPTAAAPSLPVSGRTMANSSPPKRATMSVSRAQPRITRGRLDQRAAAGQVAVRVVDRLEPVEIDEQQRQRPAAARGALGFPAQHLVQVARVVQLRQVVGDRQRLGALQPQRVVERQRRRPRAAAAALGARRRAAAASVVDGCAVERRPARRSSVPRPTSGSGHRQRRRPAPGSRAVVARRSARQNSSPLRSDPAADGLDAAGPASAVSAALGQQRRLRRRSSTTTSPSTGAGSQSRRLVDEQFATTFGIERCVRGADQRRAARRPCQTARERALTGAQAGGEVGRTPGVRDGVVRRGRVQRADARPAPAASR